MRRGAAVGRDQHRGGLEAIDADDAAVAVGDERHAVAARPAEIVAPRSGTPRSSPSPGASRPPIPSASPARRSQLVKPIAADEQRRGRIARTPQDNGCARTRAWLRCVIATSRSSPGATSTGGARAGACRSLTLIFGALLADRARRACSSATASCRSSAPALAVPALHPLPVLPAAQRLLRRSRPCRSSA